MTSFISSGASASPLEKPRRGYEQERNEKHIKHSRRDLTVHHHSDSYQQTISPKSVKTSPHSALQDGFGRHFAV
jgi:hypothetical protein